MQIIIFGTFYVKSRDNTSFALNKSRHLSLGGCSLFLQATYTHYATKDSRKTKRELCSCANLIFFLYVSLTSFASHIIIHINHLFGERESSSGSSSHNHHQNYIMSYNEAIRPLQTLEEPGNWMKQ